MLILLVPLILALASIGISRLLDIKAEKSLFILVCSIILICLIFGMIGILKAGLYLTYAIIILAITYLIFESIKDVLFSKKQTLKT